MIFSLLFLYLAAAQPAPDLVRKIADSGRVVEIATPPSERAAPPPQVVPGAPPLLSFRLLEGKQRSRYANLDLVIDDAGH